MVKTLAFDASTSRQGRRFNQDSKDTRLLFIFCKQPSDEPNDIITHAADNTKGANPKSEEK